MPVSSLGMFPGKSSLSSRDLFFLYAEWIGLTLAGDRNIMASTYAVAEKGADLIKKDISA